MLSSYLWGRRTGDGDKEADGLEVRSPIMDARDEDVNIIDGSNTNDNSDGDNIDRGGDKRLEQINVALQQLIEDKRREGQAFSAEDRGLLSHLVSQLESLKKDGIASDLSEEDRPIMTKAMPSDAFEVASKEGNKEPENQEVAKTNEIAKELKRVRRQNVITHCLLSVLIVVTAVWQFSAVSMVLSVKNKVSHPVQALGNMISGAFMGGGNLKEELDKLSSPGKNHQVEASPLPPIGVPELPHVDLPKLALNNNDDIED